jgi:hypothetical protein
VETDTAFDPAIQIEQRKKGPRSGKQIVPPLPKRRVGGCYQQVILNLLFETERKANYSKPVGQTKFIPPFLRRARSLSEWAYVYETLWRVHNMLLSASS